MSLWVGGSILTVVQLGVFLIQWLCWRLSILLQHDEGVDSESTLTTVALSAKDTSDVKLNGKKCYAAINGNTGNATFGKTTIKNYVNEEAVF